ncbi:MAG: oxygen-dependent coproporphyrinogen oxidase [Bacteroidota bacterium]|nr:oxygen-dependent coproporphyrinogen oxidase [Bacteroidota bacterium]
MDKEEIASWFKTLQDDICKGLTELDGSGSFLEDEWSRDGGGGGISRIMVNGTIIEKGGVNYSKVFGETPLSIAAGLNLESSDFFATGISIVMHPQNPMVPIIHMNTRYFEMKNGIKWFGGGIDLTPHYIDPDDAAFFHTSLKEVCDKHQRDYYLKFKKWADDYFFITHRNETRGIGGIFFDRLNDDEPLKMESIFHFVKDVGRSFLPIYSHIANKNKNMSYTDKEKDWQMIRRGRYVEFNLVLDKGTKFGLDSNGRIESILMSLPPQANWLYNFTPEPQSAEYKTLQLLKKDIFWAK